MKPTDPIASSAAHGGPRARVDLYAAAHARLRLLMSRALWSMGSLDVAEPKKLADALLQLEQMTDAVREHLRSESDYLHTAIEARCPGGAAPHLAQHAARLEAACDLDDEARALRAAGPEQASALARRLYRHLSRFTELGHQHMQELEQRHNALLWRLYDDAELIEIGQRMQKPDSLLFRC